MNKIVTYPQKERIVLYMQVYDHPHFYEIAFSHRDIPAEVNFIEQVIQRFSLVPVRSVLELASGNSPHMKELCGRGYSYTGLELNEQMVVYSRDKIAAHNLQATILHGDMIDFRLSSPADCVLVLLSSFFIQSDQEFDAHMKSVARALRSGGLYVLDGAISYFPEDIGTYVWSETKDGLVVDVSYDRMWLDEDKGLIKGTLILEVAGNGESQRVQHNEIRKVYPVAEFMEKVESTGDWKYVDAFCDFDINARPNPAGRSIAILRRS